MLQGIAEITYLQATMGVVPESLITIDSRGKFLSLYSFTRRIFGDEPDDAPGNHINVLLPESCYLDNTANYSGNSQHVTVV